MRYLRLQIACFILLGSLCASFSFAQMSPKDKEQFILNNPDGNKFKFTQDFLRSLHYISINEERPDSKIKMTRDFEFKRQRLTVVMDNLKKNNINLRIAKNIMQDYIQTENLLMLKSATLFVEFCDKRIEENNKEHELLLSVYDLVSTSKESEFDKEDFYKKEESILKEKGEASQKLLEASLLVPKILLSPQLDNNGEFTRLGISLKEKKELIKQLEVFKDETYAGGLKEGQTYLEGSIAAIREFLEKSTLPTLDG